MGEEPCPPERVDGGADATVEIVRREEPTGADLGQPSSVQPVELEPVDEEWRDPRAGRSYRSDISR